MANFSEAAHSLRPKFLCPGEGLFAQSLGASHVPIELSYNVELIHQPGSASTGALAVDFFKVAFSVTKLSHVREKPFYIWVTRYA